MTGEFTTWVEPFGSCEVYYTKTKGDMGSYFSAPEPHEVTIDAVRSLDIDVNVLDVLPANALQEIEAEARYRD